jgi:hypothetical protein
LGLSAAGQWGMHQSPFDAFAFVVVIKEGRNFDDEMMI